MKQSFDQDPEGVLIRRWVPELSVVPDAFIHVPWRMPDDLQRAIGVQTGRNYPTPIADHLAAPCEARQRLAAVRCQPESREEARDIQQKMSSRRGARRSRKPPGPRRSWVFEAPGLRGGVCEATLGGGRAAEGALLLA